MYQEYYDFIYGRRASGVSHHSPEKIIELFTRAADHPEELADATQFFLGGLDGDLGHLNDNDLKNIQYTIIGFCYYLCSFLIERHVDPELAYNNSDYFISKADGICSFNEARELFDMMGKLSFSLIHRSKRPAYGYTVEKSIHYIEQNLYSALTAIQVAKFMGLNPEYLSRVFKAETGKTLYRFIQESKLREAKALLTRTNKSITEIAHDLGYSSIAHFSAAFQRMTGFPPSEYRNRKLPAELKE